MRFFKWKKFILYKNGMPELSVLWYEKETPKSCAYTSGRERSPHCGWVPPGDLPRARLRAAIAC